MRLIPVLLAALALSACSPNPDTAMGKQSPAVSSNARVSVTRIGVIEDDLAYDNRRGIYLIHDNQTGSDFVGVSGIGISELGSHPAGKRSAPDER